MRRIISLYLALLSCNLIASPTDIKIEGRLFYHETGQWSENIFSKNFHIWNAKIGEGSLKSPASRTLFVVKAQQNKAAAMKIKVVHHLAKKAKTVYDEIMKFPTLYEKNKYMHFPFMLSDTTYGTYKIIAHRVDYAGKKFGEEISSSVNFAGGE